MFIYVCVCIRFVVQESECFSSFFQRKSPRTSDQGVQLHSKVLGTGSRDFAGSFPKHVPTSELLVFPTVSKPAGQTVGFWSF